MLTNKKKYKQEWSKKNREHVNAYNRLWRREHKEQALKREQTYREKNREKLNEYSRKWNKQTHYLTMYHQKLKEKVILHYSPDHKCQWKEGCEWTDSRVLSVDHINNNGAKHLREIKLNTKGRGSGSRFYLWLIRNNFPNGFQILCMNHQWIKRANYYRERSGK